MQLRAALGRFDQPRGWWLFGTFDMARSQQSGSLGCETAELLEFALWSEMTQACASVNKNRSSDIDIVTAERWQKIPNAIYSGEMPQGLP